MIKSIAKNKKDDEKMGLTNRIIKEYCKDDVCWIPKREGKTLMVSTNHTRLIDPQSKNPFEISMSLLGEKTNTKISDASTFNLYQMNHQMTERELLTSRSFYEIKKGLCINRSTENLLVSDKYKKDCK